MNLIMKDTISHSMRMVILRDDFFSSWYQDAFFFVG